jgi:hypothetical protein
MMVPIPIVWALVLSLFRSKACHLSIKHQCIFKEHLLNAGQTYHITTKHTIESDVDIFYALQPLGFTRAVPETKAEPKRKLLLQSR